MIFSKKTNLAEKPLSEVKLIPILTIDQLLTNLKNQTWLDKIKSYLNLPDTYFEALYLGLIGQLAGFTQILPATTEGKLGSLLSDSIGRALLALKDFRQSDPEKLASDPRYTYALFSAALLLNIGQMTSTKVTLSDSAGRFIEDWLPYQGNMIGRGEYYKIHRYAQIPSHLHRHTTTILARQVLPEIGFSWISEDIRLLHMWLSLLNGDKANAGSLELVFSITPAEIEQFWKEESPLLSIENVEMSQPLETQEAENFLHWLKTEIEKGNLPINQPNADIIVLQEGVFLSMQLFKEFCAAFSSQNHIILAKAFNHLGLTELSGGDFKFCQYFEKQMLDKKQKVDFKGENGKGVLSFLQKNLLSLSHQNKPIEKQGVLLKEKEIIFSQEIDSVPNARISPETQPVSALPRLDTALGMEAIARII